VRIAVRNGHLELADGIGQHRRAGRFSRATCGIKRLVVRGSAYFITGEALAWLIDIGAAFVNLGFDGELLAGWSAPGTPEPALRRAQAIAPWTDHGTELVLHLLEQKVLGQCSNLERFFPSAEPELVSVRGYLERLRQAPSPHAMREAEGNAAAAYWSAWERLPVTFARRDLPRIPDHWRSFGSRVSAVSSKPFQASNPANALLNYLYAILAAETRACCLTVGLDPDLGLFHTDERWRASLVYDLMEPARAAVDAWLFHALQDRVWTYDDFAEVQKGVCRVLPPLAHALAETALAWRKTVAPIVEHGAHVLRTMTSSLALPSALSHVFASPLQTRRTGASTEAPRYRTPLTQRNRQRVEKQATPPTPTLPRACHNCGVIITKRDRAYCDDCLPEVEAERRQKFIAGAAKARERMQALRAAGEDVQHRADVRERSRTALARVREAEREWEAAHRPVTDEEPARYQQLVAPRLATISVTQIARAAGVSTTTAITYRRGAVPHPRHWEALAKLAGVEFSLDSAVVASK
jgi:CRISPR-associated endonuclease Cas1